MKPAIFQGVISRGTKERKPEIETGKRKSGMSIGAAIAVKLATATLLKIRFTAVSLVGQNTQSQEIKTTTGKVESPRSIFKYDIPPPTVIGGRQFSLGTISPVSFAAKSEVSYRWTTSQKLSLR